MVLNLEVFSLLKNSNLLLLMGYLIYDVSMKLQIKKINPDAVIPTFAYEHDAGMDLYSVETCEIASLERRVIKTGIAVAIPKGHVGLVWPKSGLAVKQGIDTLAGVIDAGYRGELGCMLINLSDAPIQIETGQKIAQMLVMPVAHPTIEEVDALPDVGGGGRGTKGFGSSGK